MDVPSRQEPAHAEALERRNRALYLGCGFAAMTAAWIVADTGIIAYEHVRAGDYAVLLPVVPVHVVANIAGCYYWHHFRNMPTSSSES
jgi:hypothetical protein